MQIEKWRLAWKLAAAFLLLAAGGCAFTGVRREPMPPLTFRYALPRLQAVLHDIPVVIDYVDCVEMAMVNKRSVFGSTSFAGTFPLRRIVLREFGHFVDENMRNPMDGATSPFQGVERRFQEPKHRFPYIRYGVPC